MNRFFSLLAIFIGLIAIMPASAHAYQVTKDTYYFLKDDGEFSDEEKDEEAQYIYERCLKDVMQRAYFNCECIAGAFRLIRDSDEKLRPQTTILNELFSGELNTCVDQPKIAGLQYEFCANYAAISRPRSRMNEEFCGCVGNTIARQFADKPLLKTHYVERLRTNALLSCSNKFK